MEPLTSELIRIGVLAAVSTYGVTEALKPVLRKLSPESYARMGVRLGALAIGAAWGASLRLDSTGAIVGVCGAALSTIIVGIVKKRLSNA